MLKAWLKSAQHSTSWNIPNDKPLLTGTDTIMRRTLDPEREMALQTPILDALDAYFDAAYTPDVLFGSVGTGAASNNDGMTLMFSAFRVPDELVPVVRQFLEEQSQIFASRVTIDDAGNVTTH